MWAPTPGALSRSAGGGLASSTSARGLGSPLSRLHWDSPLPLPRLHQARLCLLQLGLWLRARWPAGSVCCGPLGRQGACSLLALLPNVFEQLDVRAHLPTGTAAASPPAPSHIPDTTYGAISASTAASSRCSLQVIAFEPNTREFGLLTANVHASGTQAHTTLLQKAVRPPAHADPDAPCNAQCAPCKMLPRAIGGERERTCELVGRGVLVAPYLGPPQRKRQSARCLAVQSALPFSQIIANVQTSTRKPLGAIQNTHGLPQMQN